MKVALIIPAYNEELTIRDCILDFYQKDSSLYFVVVNNNSKNKTYEKAHEALKECSAQGVVLNEYRQGKGFAVRTAIHSIDADVYVMIDADCTYKAKNLDEMLKPILNEEADLVVGNRHAGNKYKMENKRRFHSFGNNLVKDLINFFFRTNLKDIMSGYRVMTKRFVKLFPMLSNGFELETEMTLHALDK